MVFLSRDEKKDQEGEVKTVLYIVLTDDLTGRDVYIRREHRRKYTV